MNPPAPAPALRWTLPAPPAAQLQESVRELRGLGVVLLILYYVGAMLDWSPAFRFSLGIDLLFILTGVALALGRRESDGSRLLRILPAYWIVLTVYAVCNTHYLQLHYTSFNLALHYLGLQGWFGDAYAMAIDEPLCLVALMLTFAAAYRLGAAVLGSPDRVLLAAGIVAVPLVYAFAFRGQAASFGYLGRPLPGFFLGLLLGRLLQAGRIEFKLGARLALAALLLAYVPFVVSVPFVTTLPGLSVIGAYLFAWKRLAAPGLEKATARALGFFGEYWLEILLIFQPAIREYNTYLEGRWFAIGSPSTGTLIIGIAIGMAVTLVVGVALHRLLRKIPFLPPIAP